jgi:hypothetical protein
MHQQMVGYSALDGDPDVYPGKIIENELLSGELDAAILWGPIAGYFAARAQPVKVAVLPLRSEPGIQFEFAMAAGCSASANRACGSKTRWRARPANARCSRNTTCRS